MSRPTLPGRGAPLEKLYYRIGEVADIVGVEPHVLRYWEGEFRSIRPQKSSRGQRIYSRRDVDTLLKVRELLYSHGFTIAGARKRLREGGVEPAAAPEPAAAVVSTPEAPSAEAARSNDDVRRVRAELVAIRDEARAFLEELSRL